MCTTLRTPVLGLLENMSGFECRIAATREVHGLSLHDALDRVVLIAREKPERLERFFEPDWSPAGLTPARRVASG